MAFEYLDQLGITSEEKNELRRLCVNSPAALKYLLLAARDRAEDWLGKERLVKILENLDKLIDPKDEEGLRPLGLKDTKGYPFATGCEKPITKKD